MKNWLSKCLKGVAFALIGIVVINGSALWVEASLGALRSERDQISARQRQIRSQLNATTAQRNSIEFEIFRLDIEIEVAMHTYQYYTDLLAWAFRELELTEADLQLAREDYGRQTDAFNARLRYLNENNTFGLAYLQILLSSATIVDILNNAETINSLMEHDQNMIAELITARNNLQQRLQYVEEFRQEIEILRIQQEIHLTEIEEREREKQITLERLIEHQEHLEQMMQSYERESEDVAARIRQAERAMAAANPWVGGVFQWPLPSYITRISSYFGTRTHPITRRTHFHSGIDIPAARGTGIYASNAGRVIFAGRNGGFGLMVLIDHGGGYSTLYAHASVLLVSEGQQVRQGDRIARVGSTGSSTGNHLHFEIRYNGELRNPLNYFSR